MDWQRFHPSPQLSDRVVSLAADVLHVGPIRIGTVATKVCPQRVIELLTVVFHHRPQPNQLLLSPLCRAGRTALDVLSGTRWEGVEIGRANRMIQSGLGSLIQLGNER